MVRLTDHLTMTIVVDWDVKPQNKQTNKNADPVRLQKTADDLHHLPFLLHPLDT